MLDLVYERKHYVGVMMNALGAFQREKAGYRAYQCLQRT